MTDFYLVAPFAIFGFALLAWAAISLLDAVCKGRVAARYAPSTDVPWHQAPNFWSDTHPGLWKWRNVLICLSFAVLSVGGWLIGPRFAAHFGTMFVLEYPGYWYWIAVLKRWIPQKQFFGEFYPSDGASSYQLPVYRLPCFGDLPADPDWLPAFYRFLGLHRWPVIGFIVAANAVWGLLLWP